MSEQLPNEQSPDVSSIPPEYRQLLLNALIQNMPLPYAQEDMEREEEEIERMHGYNECRDEVLEMIKRVLGTPEKDDL